MIGFITLIMFMPCIFVEHNMAAKEWMALKKQMGNEVSLPSPKWYTLLALMAVFFLQRVNITMNERYKQLITFTEINDYVILYVLYSLSTPVAMDEFGWSEPDATFNISLVMAATGLIGFVSFLWMNKLTKR